MPHPHALVAGSATELRRSAAQKELTMSLQERLEAARDILVEHNRALGYEPPTDGNADKFPPGAIDPAQFVTNVKTAGGTSEDRLRAMSYEDITPLLVLATTPPEGVILNVKPVALAKDVAKVFRGKDEPAEGKEEGKPEYVSTKKAERLTPAQLVDAFDPDDHTNAVGKRLAEISKGQRFLVYPSGRTLDRVTSKTLLEEIRRGYPERNNVSLHGEVYPLYRVGELPDDLVDENPLYRGRPLRPDGTCDQTNRSWEGVPMNVRQMVRLAVESGEVTISIDAAHNLIDIAVGEEAHKRLTGRYTKAALRFRELEGRGELPKLRIPLRSVTVSGKETFVGGRKVVAHVGPNRLDPRDL